MPPTGDLSVPATVVDALRAAAIPLATCEAGHGFDDIRPIGRIVGDARIVGLGEATHGTREFFQLKHRMLEFLVEEMGFSAFAIEAGFPECRMLDRYVTSGEGDPLDGITNMVHWPWNTEEVLALVRWMRRHNETAKRPVRFYGFDMQSPALAVREVIGCLRDVDAEFAAELTRQLRPLANDFAVSVYRSLTPDRQRVVAGSLREARVRIEALAGLNPQEHAFARLHATVATQAEETLRTNYEGGIRDRSMAENLRSLLELEGPEGRIVAWAHNFHVGKDADDGPMGFHLKRWFGVGYVVFGMAFGNGSFQAFDSSGAGGWREFVAPAPPVGSLDETLARTGIPVFALDLSRLSEGTPAGEWLKEPRVTRTAGAQFGDDPAERASFAVSGRIGESFDGILFVKETTTARPNPDRRRLPPGKDAASGDETLPDFTGSMQGGVPADWIAEQPHWRDGFETIREHDVVGLRRGKVPWEWGSGTQQHAVNAAPYRGKRIRLSAEGRAVVTGGWDGAYLALFADQGKPGWIGGDQVVAACRTTLDEPWTRDNWEPRHLEIDVPVDADYLAFAFVLAGNGSAWIRSITLEPVKV